MRSTIVREGGESYPDEDQIDVAPRAVAETAIQVLNEERRRGKGPADAARGMIDRAAVDLVSPLLRRRIESNSPGSEIPVNSTIRPGEGGWLGIILYSGSSMPIVERSNSWTGVGQRSVRRLLELLTDDSMGPGFLGLIEHDLGATALDEGKSLEADRHQLRAFRLLQAAGYRNVTRRVLFNLAVGDLDQLEIQRAEDRLTELAEEEPDGPYMRAERARLALASGPSRRISSAAPRIRSQR